MQGALPPVHGGRTFNVSTEDNFKNYYCQVCLSENNHKNSECRQQSKDYLQCRMDRGLMAKEDWSKLGFREAKAEAKTSEAAS